MSAGTFRKPEVLAVVEQFSQALPLTVAQIRDAVIGGEPENLRWQLIQLSASAQSCAFLRIAKHCSDWEALPALIQFSHLRELESLKDEALVAWRELKLQHQVN